MSVGVKPRVRYLDKERHSDPREHDDDDDACDEIHQRYVHLELALQKSALSKLDSIL